MKANELLKYVSTAANAVDSNSVMPILKNLLFSGNTIKATDLKTSLEVKTPYDFGEAVAVDTQKLVALLKSLGKQDIEIEFGAPTTKIKSSSGKYSISAFDGAEFPEIEFELGENTAKGFLFEHALDLTKGSVSNDELRPVMTGVYFDTSLGYVVSTNGHKLSRYQATFKGDSFILPTSVAGLFKTISDENVHYTVTGNKIHFVTQDLKFNIVKIEGQYPPYDRVIPQNNEKSLTLEQKDLLTALKRVSLFSSETSMISLELGDTVKIKGTDLNFGNSADETIQGTYEGDPLTIGLNAKYLIDLLNISGEGKITMTFNESNKPVLIYNSTNPRYLQLVMPVNI